MDHSEETGRTVTPKKAGGSGTAQPPISTPDQFPSSPPQGLQAADHRLHVCGDAAAQVVDKRLTVQFEAAKVTAISPDRGYLFVEGSTTGIPMDQVTKVDPPAQHIQGAHIPSGVQIFPPSISMAPPNKGAVAREVSSLPEGEAVLQWPAAMSAESVSDLEAWLNLVVAKLKRRYPAESKS